MNSLSKDGVADLRPYEISSQSESFDAFVRTNLVGLVRYASLLSGSVAEGEDIVQDVLIRLHPRWPQITVAGPALPYVRRAVTNEFVSWRRRWSTRNIRPAGDDLPHRTVDPWATQPVDPAMWASLQRLPRQQRAAVVLRYYQDLEIDEIATALACRPATVRTHLARAMATLRIQLGGHQEDGR